MKESLLRRNKSPELKGLDFQSIFRRISCLLFLSPWGPSPYVASTKTCIFLPDYITHMTFIFTHKMHFPYGIYVWALSLSVPMLLNVEWQKLGTTTARCHYQCGIHCPCQGGFAGGLQSRHLAAALYVRLVPLQFWAASSGGR